MPGRFATALTIDSHCIQARKLLLLSSVIKSVRDLVRLNNIFYLSLFAILVTMSGVYLYRMQKKNAIEQIQRTGERAEGRIKREKDFLEQNLHVLHANLQVLKLSPGQKAIALYSTLAASALAPQKCQYNGYLALEPRLAEKYSAKKGLIVTTYRAPTDGAAGPDGFATKVFQDPQYQQNTDEVWYHVAKKSRGIEFTNLYFDRTYMKKWMITAALGVYEENRFEGMVGIDLLLEDFLQNVENLKLGNTGGVIVYDTRTHQLLTETSGPQKDFTGTQAPFASIRPFASDEKERNEYLISVHSLESPPWTVVSFQQSQEAMEPALQQILLLAAIGTLGLLFLSFYSRVIDARINRPFYGLVESLLRNIRSARRNEPMTLDLRVQTYREMRLISRLVSRLVRAINRRMGQHLKAVEEERLKSTHSARMAAVGQMAGNVAHEINSPLAAISLHAELLEDELTRMANPPSGSLHRVKAIRQIVERIAKTIRGLRSISREGTNDPIEELPLEQILRDTLEVYGARLRDGGVELTIGEIPDVILQVRGVQISQVFLNLMNNSYDAIQDLAERWIRVDFEVGADRVSISITDSGSGIPAEVAEKMMQPFFTTKDVNRGTGLGLSISKSIIEEHGGQLIYDAGSPNTRFVIELPKLEKGA